MRRTIGRLSTARVRTAKPKAGRNALMLGDGGGLWLQCTLGEGGHVRRSWTFRYEIAGKRREMGLGPTHTIGLAEARDKARALRQQLLEDVDPLEAREAARRAKLAERARTVTFRQCAQMYLDLHQDGWSFKHRQQWTSTLRDYVYPVLGELSVADIDSASVLKVVEPIWKSRVVTAMRIRGRIESVLDYAAASGLRRGDNPAAHVATALPKKAQIQEVEHHAALAWQDVPAFMHELRQRQSVSARCLEFVILTAARSGEAIGARWDEIYFKEKVWNVPAERMKANKAHRVPLSECAIAILQTLPRRGPYCFSTGNDAPVSDIRRLLRRMRPDTTVHGMRSAFRDWCAERTNYPDHVAEAALAHSVGSAVVKAYKRGDLFEKRRRLMAAWADFCTEPAPPGAVTPLRRVGTDA